MKTIAVATLLFALWTTDCGKKRPQPPPLPTPTPVPTAQPTPTPSPSATPTPEPSPTPFAARPPQLTLPPVDLAPYIRQQGGIVVEVDTTKTLDVGKLINAADHFDGPGKLVIRGGGAIHTQVSLSHDSEWEGQYTCETQTLEGCILLGNGVMADARNATIYGPTFFDGAPAITVFQTAASAKDNYASAHAVTVRGFTLIGRQERTDGGVRQVVSFGNCIDCAALYNTLHNSPSIGIQCGGGAATGNHGERCLVYGNKLTRFAAAAIALVNVKGAVVEANDIRDPGRRRGEPGGISGIDIETNNTDDCAQDIRITNNYIGFGNAAFQSIGNGILGQNVYSTTCAGGLVIANNVIDGWEGRNGLEAANNTWGLSGGLFFKGNWPGGLVAGNLIVRALQPGISLYGVSGLTVSDTWAVNSGGGGSPGIYLEGAVNNAFNRVRLLFTDSIRPGSTAEWITCDATSAGNSFTDVEHRGIFCAPARLAAPRRKGVRP